MSPRTEKVLGWSGVISLIGLFLTVVVGAVSFGRRDAEIDHKVDRVEYQKDRTKLAEDLGALRGDMRVLRAFACRQDAHACSQ